VELAAHLGRAVPLATPRVGIPELPLFPSTNATEREALEPGSFHERISSKTNPFNQSRAKIKELIPAF